MNIYELSTIHEIAKEEFTAYGESRARKDWAERAQRAESLIPDTVRYQGANESNLRDAVAIWKSYAEGRNPS